MSVQDLAQEILSLEPGAIRGTLRTFGCWFGRPWDNTHWLRRAEVDGDLLSLSFQNDELLEVWRPSQLLISESSLPIPETSPVRLSLTIPMAARVRWSWYLFGREKEPENLRHHDYVVNGDLVTSTTSSEWPSDPSLDEPAVELL